MNEAETRAEHIDPALRAAGWGVVEGTCRHHQDTTAFSPITRLEGLPKQRSPARARARSQDECSSEGARSSHGS